MLGGTLRGWLVIVLALILSVTLPSSLLLPENAASTVAPFAPTLATEVTSAARNDSELPPIDPGAGLRPGTVHSTFAPTVSSVSAVSKEPELVRTASAYEYITAFGNYSFRANAPYVMSYSEPDGTEEVPWSAFLVGASTGGLAIPMRPESPIVTVVDNHRFAVSYTAVLHGVAQGQVRLQTTFPSSAAPTIEVNFTQSGESSVPFSILWAIVAGPSDLHVSSGNLLDIRSLNEDVRAASSNNKAILTSPAAGVGHSSTLLVDWSDTGAGELYVGPVAPFGDVLGHGLIVVFPNGQAKIDPSMVDACWNTYITAFTSERRTFYYDGFYYAFYDLGSGCTGSIQVRSSPDGITWDLSYAATWGTIHKGFDVSQRGPEVAVGWIEEGSQALYAMTGTLQKGYVFWGPSVRVANTSGTAGPVGLTIGSDGIVWVTAAWGSGSSYSRYIYKSYDPVATGFALAQPAGTENSASVMAKPVALPDGSIAIVESRQGDSRIYWESYSGGTWTSWSSRSTNIYTTGVFYAQVSSVAQANGSIWVVYPAQIPGTPSTQSVDYFTVSPAGAVSGGSVDTLSSTSIQYYYPALGADALGRLYLFWNQYDGTAWTIHIGMYFPTAAHWANFETIFTFPSGEGAFANITSAEAVSGDAFALFTLKDYTYGVAYAATFIAAPIALNVGSSPSQPWNRDGISPYGAYFQQQSEYVAPGSGLLTVVQTDLESPGRGIDLAISRVFSTPRFFFSPGGVPTPYLYEPDSLPYSSAPTNLGPGWQLNLPWVGGQYLHFVNGQTYVVQWDKRHTFTNHAGEQFVLSSYDTGDFGYALVTADGTNYTFNFQGQPLSIRDATGANAITFSYTNGLLTTITDTVGRAATLAYDGSNRLQSISYGGRTVRYSYDPASGRLIQVLDPIGRATRFSYVSWNPWLLETVNYPSGGRSVHYYANAPFGEATSSLVSLLNVENGTRLVKSTGFSYDFLNGRVHAANVSTGDSNGKYGYTVHNFAIPPTGMTTTVMDSTSRQLRKVVTWYTQDGQITQTDTYNGNATSKTFSSFEALDNWGNVIYMQDPVGHQTFSSFANTDSPNEFYTPGRLSQTPNGPIMSSNFDDQSLNGWTLRSGGGSGGNTVGYVRLDDAGDPASAPNIKLASLYTINIVSSATRSFAPQSGTFVAEGRIRADRATYGDQVFFLLRTTTGAYAVYFAFSSVAWAMGWSSDGYNYVYCAPYVPGEWYLIAFEVNVTAGTYNIYINGVASSACIGARLRTSGAISSLVVQAGYAGGRNQPTIAWGDDFRVYTQGRLTISGVPAGTEVEAVDAMNGAVANATMVAAGTSSLSLNTLNVSSRNYFLRFYNTTQAITNPNLEAQAAWNFGRTSTSIGGGYDTARAHTGRQSYAIRFTGDVPSGAFGDLYQDVSGFRTGDSVRQWLKIANLTGNGGCSGSPNPSLIKIQLAVSEYGTDAGFVPLANITMNVFPTGLLVTGWMELAGMPTESSFRLHARVTAQSTLSGCALAVYYDDIDAPPEYTSPVSDFLGGDAYAYTPPTWRSGEFYATTVPSDMHNRLLGTLSWQNVSSEPASTPPSRTFYQYNAVGEVTQTKTYHNGSWLFSNQTYDSFGNLVYQSNPNGQITRAAFDAQYGYAYPTSVTRYVDSLHPVTGIATYDFTTGLLISQTNPRGYATNYNYDVLGRLVKKTQPQVNGLSPVTTYVYDDTQDVVTVYDPDSAPRAFHYDMETQLNGAIEDLSGYGSSGTLGPGVSTGVVGKVGNAAQFPGTTSGNIAAPSTFLFPTQAFTITFWVYPTSLPASYTYLAGQPAGANNCVYLYQNNKVLTAVLANTAGSVYGAPTVTLALNGWTHVAFTFDGSTLRLYINGVQQGSGNAFSGTPCTPNGTFEVGGYGGLVGITGTVDEFQVFASTIPGSTISSIYQGTQGGRYLKTYYDGIGRKVRAVQRSFFSGPGMSSYRQETYTDNYQDQIDTYVDPNGSAYQMAYDFLGRPTTVRNPDWSVRTTSFDDVNRLVTMTDEVGHKTQELYDIAGRLVSVRQYTSSSSYVATGYAYNLSGELVGVTDPLGQTTRQVYDDAGRLVQTLYPDGTKETYVYDNVGNVVMNTDRGGRTIRSAYDGLNQLTTVTYPGGATLRYVYDPDGNLVSVQNGTANLWFGYDALDRMTSRSLVISGDATNFTTSYGYDAAGNLLSLAYPDNQGTLTYAYDAFYRVTTMTFGSKTIASFTYRKDDLLSTISYGDGSSAKYVFNDRGFPLEIKLTAGKTNLMDLIYTENATGAIIGLTNKAVSGDTETYVYDWLDRMTAATGPWGTLTYGYDSAGNRLLLKSGSTTTYYKYGAYNKLCESSTSDSNTCASPPSSSVTKYYYDASGDIVNRATNANASYAFDLDNRLVKACIASPCASSNAYTFAYDGLGNRIRESGPSGSSTYTNTYVASGDQMLYLKGVVGATTTKTIYLYAGSLLVATVSGTTYSYFHEDHLGSVRLVTRAGSGGKVTVVFSTNYQPFGAQYAASGTDPNVKYTGQWSEAAGLYWNHARYYDPTLGRFVSADPVLGSLSGPQTLNRYAYVGNNPLTYVDPSGEFLQILAGAIIGGLVGYGLCVWATGGWTSRECGAAGLIGMAVGAFAGATWGLGMAAFGVGEVGGIAVGSWAAVGAGVASGAAAGAQTYFFASELAMGAGLMSPQDLSMKDFALSVGMGMAFGAVGGKSYDPETYWGLPRSREFPTDPFIRNAEANLVDAGPAVGGGERLSFRTPRGYRVEYHTGHTASGLSPDPHYVVRGPVGSRFGPGVRAVDYSSSGWHFSPRDPLPPWLDPWW